MTAFVHIMFFVRTRVLMAAFVLIMFFLCPRFTFLVSLSALHYFTRPRFACQLCPREALSMSYVHVLHVSLSPYSI